MKALRSIARLFSAALTTFALGAATATTAFSAQFPEKGSTITLIVPFGAGGLVDIMGRTMASHWDAKWGTRTIVMNKPGANGKIALSELLRNKPDGHTIAFTQGFDTQLTYLNAEANAPYSRSHLIPVAMVQRTPSVWLVKADSPYQTMEELINAAKTKPDGVTFGSPTTRGPAMLYVEEFKKKRGAKLDNVPFNDGPSMISALIGGHIDAAISNPAIALPHIKSGRLKAIMVSGDKPVKYFPDVPYSTELGLDISSLGSNTGLTLAGSTPEPIVQTWSEMIKEITGDPQLKAKMDSLGINLEYASPSEYASLWNATEAEVSKYLMRANGKVRPIQ
jgi:tripartite-type tricarboxylate transporter receptor subunit TctC